MSDKVIIGVSFTVVSITRFALRSVYKSFLQSSKLKLITRAGGDLLIRYRWVHANHFEVSLYGLIILIWPLLLTINRNENAPSFAAFFVFLLLWLSVFAYFPVVGFINETTVLAMSNGAFTATYGPLPAFRNPHITIRGAHKIYYDETIIDRAGNKHYPIYAENHLGHKVVLLHNIDSEADAAKVVYALREWMAETVDGS